MAFFNSSSIATIGPINANEAVLDGEEQHESLDA